jgi:hypothetical protein
MAKKCMQKLIRDSSHLFDPNAIEYDVIEDVLVNEELQIHVSGARVTSLTIGPTTTMADIQTAIEADATANSYIP